MNELNRVDKYVNDLIIDKFSHKTTPCNSSRNQREFRLFRRCHKDECKSLWRIVLNCFNKMLSIDFNFKCEHSISKKDKSIILNFIINRI